MNRALPLPLLLLGLAGCSGLVPSVLRMPEFGAQFQPAIHQEASLDAATLILYRDPEIDERIKYGFNIAGIEPTRWAQPIGYLFDGAFLWITRPPGVWRVNGGSSWWEEDRRAGQSFLLQMTAGEPPAEEEGGTLPTRVDPVRREFELRAGTVTYLKLTRSASTEIVSCGETAQTLELCEIRAVEVALELVPPDTARAELAGLRQTDY